MRKFVLGIGVIAAMLMAGCGGNGGGSSLEDPEVRVFNMSPDSGPLDFQIDGENLAANVAIFGGTADFARTDDRPRELAILQTGASVEIDVLGITFQKEREYLVSAIGALNYVAGEEEKRLRVLLTEIDREAPNGNRARLYVFHGFQRSVGFETPAIDFQNPGDNPQFALRDIGFAASRSFEVDSGTQTFQVRRNGTEQVYAQADLTFVPGGVYAVYVTGVEGGSGAAQPTIRLVQLQTE